MEKVILREWRFEDTEALMLAANNPKIAANMRNSFPSPYTLKNAEWYVNDCMKNNGRNQIVYAITLDGKVCGNIGVFLQTDVYEKSAELSYWVSEDFWGRGIATQAVKAICQKAFSAFDIIRIYAEPFSHNDASKSVLEKAGFTYEGTMRNAIYKNGKVFAYCIYSLLREEMLIETKGFTGNDC